MRARSKAILAVACVAAIGWVATDYLGLMFPKPSVRARARLSDSCGILKSACFEAWLQSRNSGSAILSIDPAAGWIRIRSGTAIVPLRATEPVFEGRLVRFERDRRTILRPPFEIRFGGQKVMPEVAFELELDGMRVRMELGGDATGDFRMTWTDIGS